MSSKDAKELFDQAHEEGSLSQAAHSVVTSIPNLSSFNDALGNPADEIPVSDVTIIGILLDDSGSIAACNNEDNVRDGHNMVIDAVLGAKQGDSSLLTTWQLNDPPINSFVLMDQAVRVDASNYLARGGTPLYDCSVEFLAAMLAKAQEFEGISVPGRTVSLIVSDGHDQHSHRFNPRNVKTLVGDLLKQNETHLVAAMGIDDAPEQCYNCGDKTLRDTELDVNTCPSCSEKFDRTNFVEVFTQMGIKEEWILTPKNDPSEIRRAFEMFSRTSAAAAGGQESFSKTAMGGFTN